MVRVVGTEKKIVFAIDRRGQGSRPVVFDAEVNVFANILARIALDDVTLGVVGALAAEGVVEPLPYAEEPPEDLRAQTPFSQAAIRAGMPPPGGFGLADLRCRPISAG